MTEKNPKYLELRNLLLEKGAEGENQEKSKHEVRHE